MTLGFAGDVHFEGQLIDLLSRPATALRPIAADLRRPDLMMLNLEAALTTRGSPEPKEYVFGSSPEALEVLASAGVDVASLANNHAVDFGPVGLRDTLAAVRDSPIGIVGIGADIDAAFQPQVASIRGTTVAVLSATTKRDRTALEWAAGPGEPGVAVAVTPQSTRLLRSVRTAADRADVVVVYLHWGKEYEACPGGRMMRYARALSTAGADVVVGSHAHVLLGAGWLDRAYVGYGLGNFVWYNQNTVSTGILELTVRGGRVVADAFVPADIHPDGRPRPLGGSERSAAVASWRQLRECTGLAANPPS